MVYLILPNQLFEKQPIITTTDSIVLLEHPIYFGQGHKMKLVLHRASMKCYCDYLRANYTNKIIYYDYGKDYKSLYKKEITMYDPTDHTIAAEFGHATFFNSPNFLCSLEDLAEYKEKIGKASAFRHKSFYVWCRKKYNIMMDGPLPTGGKWSFDTENRKSFPDNFAKDVVKFRKNTDKYTKSAIAYVNKHFKSHPGSPDLYFPIDFRGSKKNMKSFLKTRIKNFGPYEDAVSSEINYGYHSTLSAVINVGLLNPDYILKQIDKYKIPIQSKEGYIRQLFWREYTRFVYLYKHKELVLGNYFHAKKELPSSWYDGTTGIEPIDDMIKKALNTAYLHHIERLMYVGNVLMLAGIKPREAYDWFMNMFIDAVSPWVMEPNVYGMSQYSSGSLMMTRPYLCSSNYMRKMSNYKKGEWCTTVDDLYHRFVLKHKKKLAKNYATAGIVAALERKNKK